MGGGVLYWSSCNNKDTVTQHCHPLSPYADKDKNYWTMGTAIIKMVQCKHYPTGRPPIIHSSSRQTAVYYCCCPFLNLTQINLPPILFILTSGINSHIWNYMRIRKRLKGFYFAYWSAKMPFRDLKCSFYSLKTQLLDITVTCANGPRWQLSSNRNDPSHLAPSAMEPDGEQCERDFQITLVHSPREIK